MTDKWNRSVEALKNKITGATEKMTIDILEEKSQKRVVETTLYSFTTREPFILSLTLYVLFGSYASRTRLH